MIISRLVFHDKNVAKIEILSIENSVKFIQEKYVRGSGVWEGDLDNETLEIYKGRH